MKKVEKYKKEDKKVEGKKDCHSLERVAAKMVNFNKSRNT